MPFKPGGEWPIPMGRVKLPEPAVSDYIIPSNVSASSEFLNKFGIPAGTASEEHTTSTTPTLTTTGDPYYTQISLSYSGDMSSSDYVGIKFSLDLTDYDVLYFASTATANNPYIRQDVYFDGSLVDSRPLDSSPQVLSDDVSSLTGTHTVEFRLVASTSVLSADLSMSIDASSSYLGRYDKGANAIDNATSTFWRPSTANAGEWLQIDAGSNSIIGGTRIYWGSNVPNAYRIQVSTDGSTWVDVYTTATPPSPNGWMEYSWPAAYVRYLRLYFDDTGGVAPEVAEFQYYSQITDRVAAEHGHGSGPEPWKTGVLSSALRKAIANESVKPKIARIRGFTIKARILKKLSELQKAGKVTPEDLSELTELLLEYADMLNP